MVDKVNKDKQSKLDSFVSQTPKASNKRDQPESSPDNSSSSTQHLDKQARLSAFGSPLISESVTSNTVSTDQVLSTFITSFGCLGYKTVKFGLFVYVHFVDHFEFYSTQQKYVYVCEKVTSHPQMKYFTNSQLNKVCIEPSE
jgi:hypothetical protein